MTNPDKILFLPAFCLLILLAPLADSHAQINYRQEMIDLVGSIGTYGDRQAGSFLVVPQNGIELLSQSGNRLRPNPNYLDVIDGIARESVFFGHEGDDRKTPPKIRNYIIRFLKMARYYDKKVMVVDYCRSPAKVRRSFAISDSLDFVPFPAPTRELDTIPKSSDYPWQVHKGAVSTLDEAQNFLYLLNSHRFSSKEEYLRRMDETWYDLIVIDLFFNDGQQLTRNDIRALQTKPNGQQRLVLAYMSIGEAEEYRYYWQPEWYTNPPSWLGEENPNWPGNYLVEYWDDRWQKVLMGSEDSYLDRIIDAGFDGVYLDLVDAYRRYE